jgi:hypothetical protein
MGEEDYPVVADEFVEVNGAVGGFSLEVWSDGSEAETSGSMLELVNVERWLEYFLAVETCN